MNTPIIYEQDEAIISENLLPPQRRLTKWKAWLTALLSSNQWLHDLVFNSYYGGDSAANWNPATTYNYGDRVKYIDNSVYESVNLIPFVFATSPNNDLYNQATGIGNWIRVLDSFIGVAERVRYNGKLIMLEWILNRYLGGVSTLPIPTLPFTGASHVNQIYITKNVVNFSDFWMATTPQGSPQSYMPVDSKYAISFMPITTSALQKNMFTINVPALVAAAITANIVAVIPTSTNTYVELITSLIKPYVRAGRSFTIVTF